ARELANELASELDLVLNFSHQIHQKLELFRLDLNTIILIQIAEVFPLLVQRDRTKNRISKIQKVL
ncbi:MAG TPA: hypothetical protein VJ987_06380, partial [Anaerolineales bacterium]|nr:hypothetical protein [Anaerolineales bacterium]